MNRSGRRSNRAMMSPLYAGAPGRVLLAFAPTEILDEVLLGDLVRITAGDPRPRRACARASGTIVMTGIAISHGERIEGTVAMAAPVFREDGIVGAIAVVGPAFRCDDDLAVALDAGAPGGRQDDQRGPRRGPFA